MPFTASAQRYHARTYTQSDGLPSSLVWDVLQDASGRMWFATRTGVAVYDGMEWRSFHKADGLGHTEQAHLALDPAGILWSASPNSNRISRFDGQHWSVLPPIPKEQDRPVRIFALAAGVWDGRSQVAVGTEEEGLWVWTGTEWYRCGPQQGLVGMVLALVPDPRHDRLLIGSETGLFELRHGEGVRIPLDLPSPAVRGLAVETLPEGRTRLWLAGREWIATLEGGVEETVLDLRRGGLNLPFLPLSNFLTLAPDLQEGVFFGNALGLAHLDAAGDLETLDVDSGLVTQGITSLFLDRERHLWVGSGRGVTKIVSFRFANYDATHGLLSNEVSAVLERASGEIVLGHEQGLTILGPRGVVTIPLHRPGSLPSPRQRVLELAEDADGNLWVAGAAMGLCRIEPGGKVRWFEQTEEFDHSALVLVDRQARLWAGTNRRLYRWQNGEFTPVVTISGIRRLFEGRDGTLYLVTEAGVYTAREGEADTPAGWKPIPGTEAESVYAFLEDRRGRIWFGTATGLFRLSSSGAARVIAPGPAIDRPIYFLVQDPQDRLWLGTDNGVLRWDGQRLEPFTVQEGLSGRETNRAAGVVDSQGRLWIGTDQGVSVYRQQYDHPGLAPQVELHTLVAGGRAHSLAAPATLAPDENDVVFRFRALSFQDEQRVRFQSWLEGFEDDWLAPYTAAQQEIRYTNLAPGSYRLHLRAASAEGVWSEPVASASIVVAPPFWQRPWFYLSAGLLAALVVITMQRYLAQRRYSGRLEAEVARRTAELATLNQEKAEFLAIAAHDLRVPLVNMRGFTAEAGISLKELTEALGPALAQLPEDARRQVQCVLRQDLPEELSFIDSSAARMDRLVTAILQLSRLERRELHLERIPMETLVRTILESLTYRLEQHRATVEVGPLPEVTADLMAMELVLQNLLANAVAYLQPERPGRIEIRGQRRGGEVVFTVRDNGRGISAEEQDKVFQIFGRAGDPSTTGEGMGLAYVRTLLRRHGGRVWFESRPGEGTVFTFALPRVNPHRD